MTKIWVRQVIDPNFKILKETSMRWLKHLRVSTLLGYRNEVAQNLQTIPTKLSRNLEGISYDQKS